MAKKSNECLIPCLPNITESHPTKLSTLITVDVHITESSPFLKVHPVTPTLGCSTTNQAYVPYAEIDDIPFIDDDEDDQEMYY